MGLILFYGFAFIALIIGTAAIYMAMIERFPVSWLYHHYFIRKPSNWIIFLVLLFWTILIYQQQGQFPTWTIIPILLAGIAVVLTYKMHQELPIYNKLSIQAQNLSETYMLCSGLLLSNPTEENMKSCNAIKSQMHVLFERIDNECPYITFYTKYIHFNL